MPAQLWFASITGDAYGKQEFYLCFLMCVGGGGKREVGLNFDFWFYKSADVYF